MTYSLASLGNLSGLSGSGYSDYYNNYGYGMGYGYGALNDEFYEKTRGYSRTTADANKQDTLAQHFQCYDKELEEINSYLVNGDTIKAMALYEDLVDKAVDKAEDQYYFDTDRSMVESALRNAYSRISGTTLSKDIDANTKSSFASGFVQGIPLIGYFSGSTSSEEAKATFNNKEITSKEKRNEKLGAMAGGAASWAAIGFAITGCNPLGAAIGAVIGSVAGWCQQGYNNIVDNRELQEFQS